MRGRNQKLKPEISSGDYLKVHSIFITIQGEGPYSGQPALFIRLSGCNLACYFCDAEFETFEELSCEQIISNLNDLSKNTKLVVITGGEPLRQSIGQLCEKLLSLGYKVQLESNGTIYQSIPKQVELVCSPKPVQNKYFMPDQRVWSHTIALKFVISATNPEYNYLPQHIIDAAKDANIPIYVQPMDECDNKLNSLNTNRCIELAHEFNANLSLQIHKILGIK